MTSAVTKCPEDIIEKFNTWAIFKEPISTSQLLPLKKKSHMKRCTNSRFLETCQSELQRGLTLPQTEWPSSMTLQRMHDRKALKERKASEGAHGMKLFITPTQNNTQVPERKTKLPINQQSMPKRISRQNQNSKRNMHPNLQWTTSYNS